MDEPVRLVCPECGAAYRIKKLRLGKEYRCKKCGTGLRSAEALCLACPSCGATSEESGVDVSTAPPCRSCQEPMALAAELERRTAEQIASENAAAVTSSTRVAAKPRSATRAASGDESDLSRLPRLIEDLSTSLAELRIGPLREGVPASGDERNFLEIAASLETNLKELNARFSGEFRELDEKVANLLRKLDASDLSALSEQVRETGSLFLTRLEEYQEVQTKAIAGLIGSGGGPGSGSGATLEIDMNDLAERLVAGLRGQAPRLDVDSGSAVDALARVADELVKEQSSNSARLDNLSAAIKTAVATISDLQEWKGALPGRVADEIGRTVEERVVGPISGALARQAPAILSELKDNKLVDIVSRSVREAQRPLLREILSGGRTGVPVWLFASVLIPLLLILGYLFLPGELGFGDGSGGVKQVADILGRMEADGVPLTVETEDRLATLEEVIVDIRDKALEHAGNAAALGEKVKSMRVELDGKDKLLKEYTDELQRQVRFKDNYKARLIQLGVSPESVRE